MSRFSLAEAKGLGWNVVHNDEEGVGTGEKLVAEKRLNAPGFPDRSVREHGATMGLLLERVFAYEAHLRARGYYQQS